jgi:phosphohistidine phosphatase
MELYLLRHGIAEDAPAGQPDSARKLTPKGEEKTAEVVKMAQAAGAKPSARIAARVLGYQGEIVQMKSLVPHGTPAAVWHDLRDYKDEESILLAGHEPLLSHLLGHLLNSPALQVEMKKSALVRIDLDGFGAAPRGTLRWMAIPKLAG